MRLCRISFLLAAAVCVPCAQAHAQDEPSLGSVARQARQQKQTKEAQAKDGRSKDGQSAKASKVITNEEIPSHVGPTSTSHTPADQPSAVSYSGGSKAPAEQWKSQILVQKNAISSLQSEIDKLNDSIHFAPANCVANCVQWNERQKQKQDQVEQMKAQLEDQRKRLEDMQEAARQQGYGSSVYDP